MMQDETGRWLRKGLPASLYEEETGDRRQETGERG